MSFVLLRQVPSGPQQRQVFPLNRWGIRTWSRDNTLKSALGAPWIVPWNPCFRVGGRCQNGLWAGLAAKWNSAPCPLIPDRSGEPILKGPWTQDFLIHGRAPVKGIWAIFVAKFSTMPILDL